MSRPWIAGLLLAAACGSSQRPEADVKPPGKADEPTVADANNTGFVDRGPGVWLRVSPADAELVVDGEPVGLATSLEATEGFLALESGIHQIVVRKKGFTTWRAEVAVKENTEPIDIVLEPAVIAD